MNNKRRDKLGHAIEILYQAIDSIHDNTVDYAFESLEDAEKVVKNCLHEEEDCMDVIPENLRFSFRYDRMRDACNAMDNALDSIQDAAGHLHDVEVSDGCFMDKDLEEKIIESIEEAISSVEDAQIA